MTSAPLRSAFALLKGMASGAWVARLPTASAPGTAVLNTSLPLPRSSTTSLRFALAKVRIFLNSLPYRAHYSLPTENYSDLYVVRRLYELYLSLKSPRTPTGTLAVLAMRSLIVDNPALLFHPSVVYYSGT